MTETSLSVFEGTRPSVLDLHIQPVTTLVFARRGMRLTSGARNGAAVVWAVQSDGEGGPIEAELVADVIADRRNELVFTGIEIDRASLERRLEAALVHEAECRDLCDLGGLPNPFPPIPELVG